jgi:hypothetical protein
VIAEEFAARECAEATAWVLVPSLPVRAGADRFWPELRRLTDGRMSLLVYTSLAELVAACGRYQPWVAVPATWLERLRQDCRFDVVAMNLDIPEPLRHKANTEDDWPGKPEAWDE